MYLLLLIEVTSKIETQLTMLVVLGSGTVLDIPEIDLELKSEAIVAKTRKLKAVWTPELLKTLTLTIQLTLKLN